MNTNIIFIFTTLVSLCLCSCSSYTDNSFSYSKSASTSKSIGEFFDNLMDDFKGYVAPRKLVHKTIIFSGSLDEKKEVSKRDTRRRTYREIMEGIASKQREGLTEQNKVTYQIRDDFYFGDSIHYCQRKGGEIDRLNKPKEPEEKIIINENMSPSDRRLFAMYAERMALSKSLNNSSYETVYFGYERTGLNTGEVRGENERYNLTFTSPTAGTYTYQRGNGVVIHGIGEGTFAIK